MIHGNSETIDKWCTNTLVQCICNLVYYTYAFLVHLHLFTSHKMKASECIHTCCNNLTRVARSVELKSLTTHGTIFFWYSSMSKSLPIWKSKQSIFKTAVHKIYTCFTKWWNLLHLLGKLAKALFLTTHQNLKILIKIFLLLSYCICNID